MEDVLNCLDKKVLSFSKLKNIIQYICIIIATLIVPAIVPRIIQLVFGKESFLFANSQLIVGSIVNTALIVSAFNVTGIKKLFAISMLPSISAIASGYIFGSLTHVTMVMLPGIWLGNMAFMLLFKYFFVNGKLNYLISSILAVIAKVGIIYGVLNIYMLFNILPNSGSIASVLRNTMGLSQFITASIASIICFGIVKCSKKEVANENLV